MDDNNSSRSCGSYANRSGGHEVVVTDHCLAVNRAQLFNGSGRATQFQEAIQRLRSNGTLEHLENLAAKDEKLVVPGIRVNGGSGNLKDGLRTKLALRMDKPSDAGEVVKEASEQSKPNQRNDNPGSYRILSIQNEALFDCSGDHDRSFDVNTISEISDIDRDDVDLVTSTRTDDSDGNHSAVKSVNIISGESQDSNAERVLVRKEPVQDVASDYVADVLQFAVEEETASLGLNGDEGSRERIGILWERLHNEKLRREEAQFLLDQLQSNYDVLLRKYAEAENTIDSLRFYRDAPARRGTPNSGGRLSGLAPAYRPVGSPLTNHHLPTAPTVAYTSGGRLGSSSNLPSSDGKGGSMPVINFASTSPTNPSRLPKLEKGRKLMTNKSPPIPVYKIKNVDKAVRDGALVVADRLLNSLSSNTPSTNLMCTNTTKASKESAYMRTECLEDEMKFLSSACEGSALEAGEKLDLLAQFQRNLSQLRRDCRQFVLGDEQLAKRLRKLRISVEELESRSKSNSASWKHRHSVAPVTADQSNPTTVDKRDYDQSVKTELYSSVASATVSSDGSVTKGAFIEGGDGSQLSSLPDSAVAKLDAALCHLRLESGPSAYIRRLSQELNGDRHNSNNALSTSSTVRSSQSPALECHRPVTSTDNSSFPRELKRERLSNKDCSSLSKERSLLKLVESTINQSLSTKDQYSQLPEFKHRQTLMKVSSSQLPESGGDRRTSAAQRLSSLPPAVVLGGSKPQNWILRTRDTGSEIESQRESHLFLGGLSEQPGKEITTQATIPSDSRMPGETKVSDPPVKPCPGTQKSVFTKATFDGIAHSNEVVGGSCIFLDNNTGCIYYTSEPRVTTKEIRNNKETDANLSSRGMRTPNSSLHRAKATHHYSSSVENKQHFKLDLLHALDEADQKSNFLRKRSREMLTLVHGLEHQ